MLELKESAVEPIIENEPAPPHSSPGFWERREVRIAVAWVLGAFGAGVFTFGFFYLKFARMIDHRLAAGAFSNTISIYTRPRTVLVGDTLTPEEVVAGLRRSGYSTSHGNPVGWYDVRPRAVEVFPGKDSYGGGQPAVLEFTGGKLTRILSEENHTQHESFTLEPQLITNLSMQREKRHLVRFAEISPALVQAVISAEDKHFFHHSGFDVFRILKAAYTDVKAGRKEQGASTLTMQLARGFWLEPEKRWKRKVEELFITMHLEDKLTKQQIFEDYANQVYLGRHGTFSISGFGEAAQAYFGKDLSQVTIAEAALLAGMVQRPSYYNPIRYPERARDRRNRVLALMRSNGYLNAEQYRQALDSPIKVTSEQSESVASHYFIDLMNDELQSKLDNREQHTRYVYTTIDPDLQQAAEDAVDIGMKAVDQQLRKKKHPDIAADQPQVALIALDPHTGEIRALVGGRNYGASQLNHVLSMRQPGSVFKPFVYAAALDTAIAGGGQIFTPASVLSDVPTTFAFNNASYQPGNFGHEFMGDVTLRTALAHSLNVATVQLAQQVGYAKVVAMARRAGLNRSIQATPSVALGAYETTPLEIAGAYTMFANQGMRITPTTISLARAPDGTVLYQRDSQPYPALDPRVAYLMVSMMQEVLRSGTGAAARSLGFTLPAAGKTGTSHDGWFAGFTSELLCVVWVGFDDNRELNLEGARSALPVWTEFMKRAAKMREYHDAKTFQAPQGIVAVNICAESGQRAGEDCPDKRYEVFISGTQPAAECELHGLGTRSGLGTHQ
ncbi:MAG TPA: PBP1A family penicillin-binding protein [Bryobacteraceae bacterium]|jgi:penicillin-binding protein 1B|nr:PBP1A family penicillin-binding protein [Bryobacteraceae bacterium]